MAACEACGVACVVGPYLLRRVAVRPADAGDLLAVDNGAVESILQPGVILIEVCPDRACKMAARHQLVPYGACVGTKIRATEQLTARRLYRPRRARGMPPSPGHLRRCVRACFERRDEVCLP